MPAFELAPDRSPLVLEEPRFADLAYKPGLVLGEDFHFFLRPRNFDLDADALLSGRLSISWRFAGDYLIYDRPIFAYQQIVPRGEWTAFGVPWPQISGLISFDLMLADTAGGRHYLAGGDIAVTAYDRLQLRDVWACGWSPLPSNRRNLVQKRKPVPGLDVGLRMMVDTVQAGVALGLLEIAVNSAAPPEYLAFSRFPYRFGGGRAFNAIPNGPTPKTTFLLAIDSANMQGNLWAEFGTMGGYAQSSIDLMDQVRWSASVQRPRTG